MDKLLRHYEQELGRLREAARRYAEAHPNTAAALELAGGCSTDPEVERLLQSVALLNAATQQLIEDGRGDFHRALLQTLQPHYLRTIPASGIVRVDTSAARPNEISAVSCLPRGTILRSGAGKFTTTFDVCIAPIKIADARFQPTINLPAALRIPQDATSTLIIELKSTANSVCFDQPILRRLRIYVDGDPALLDAVLIESLCVCLEVEGRWTVLDNSPFSAVGFDVDEALLPPGLDPQSPRMLTELFHLPQKYQFVDLDLGRIATLCPSGCKQIALHIVLPSCKAEFRGTTSENFRLACTPAANVFPQSAMPIRLDGRREGYRCPHFSRQFCQIR